MPPPERRTLDEREQLRCRAPAGPEAAHHPPKLLPQLATRSLFVTIG